ncbi:hypothetical protein [Spiroplasma eriocheiris]|uniref:Uncharacterized protein n=1 Tax=Spiroplasma eriocheiris TaxID=315358 RepID=A0A0H3XKG3_9MOLU|nr:hypothetical protein [Spiroplasma eriocheiris]AHF57964.1 hypothetical protein SPE_0844 [Spiroplasma eriocheiris CCTCC M 207170]AKM54406.1 hypothetical protein SERIO_v1c08460 [Spiroplasma eriocheiris]
MKKLLTLLCPLVIATSSINGFDLMKNNDYQHVTKVTNYQPVKLDKTFKYVNTWPNSHFAIGAEAKTNEIYLIAKNNKFIDLNLKIGQGAVNPNFFLPFNAHQGIVVTPNAYYLITTTGTKQKLDIPFSFDSNLIILNATTALYTISDGNTYLINENGKITKWHHPSSNFYKITDNLYLNNPTLSGQSLKNSEIINVQTKQVTPIAYAGDYVTMANEHWGVLTTLNNTHALLKINNNNISLTPITQIKIDSLSKYTTNKILVSTSDSKIYELDQNGGLTSLPCLGNTPQYWDQNKVLLFDPSSLITPSGQVIKINYTFTTYTIIDNNYLTFTTNDQKLYLLSADGKTTDLKIPGIGLGKIDNTLIFYNFKDHDTYYLNI